MFKKSVFFVAFLVVISFTSGHISAQHDLLEKCFKECWGVDPHTAVYLMRKFEPLFAKEKHLAVIDAFIEKSNQLGIDFSDRKEVQCLPDNDALLAAPKQHLVIFENLFVRIFWGSTSPGEREPFHVHAWKSLMVVLKPTIFEVEYPNGTIEIWDGEIGVYELPANERYACRNIGLAADECLRFEIKN